MKKCIAFTSHAGPLGGATSGESYRNAVLCRSRRSDRKAQCVARVVWTCYGTRMCLTLMPYSVSDIYCEILGDNVGCSVGLSRRFRWVDNVWLATGTVANLHTTPLLTSPSLALPSFKKHIVHRKPPPSSSSQIIDPWGAVIAQCSRGEGVCVAEVDSEYVDRVREQMPVQQHRRAELYNLG